MENVSCVGAIIYAEVDQSHIGNCMHGKHVKGKHIEKPRRRALPAFLDPNNNEGWHGMRHNNEEDKLTQTVTEACQLAEIKQFPLRILQGGKIDRSRGAKYGS